MEGIMVFPFSTMNSPNSSSQSKDNFSFYYYIVLAIAMTTIILLAFNMVIADCCESCKLVSAIKWFLRSLGLLSSSSKDDPISQLIPAYKYKMEKTATADNDCSVCLMEFKNGEEVRRMPECNHLFHAECIDMWLYSHSNCPMCRANVLPQAVAEARDEGSQSRRRLAESSGLAHGVVSV